MFDRTVMPIFGNPFLTITTLFMLHLPELAFHVVVGVSVAIVPAFAQYGRALRPLNLDHLVVADPSQPLIHAV